MRSVVPKAGLALALWALFSFLVACGGQDDVGDARSDGEAQPAADRLQPSLPADFPLYPGLKIVDTLTLGDLYIVKASSEDQPEKVVSFYEEELAKGRWELLSTDSSPEKGVIFFTAAGFPEGGRVAVSRDKGENGLTIVAIALPIDFLGGNDE